MIHERAVIGKTAVLGDEVEVGPLAVIEDGARLGAGCRIHSHAVIRRGVELGAGVIVHPFAVIGGDPQDLRFVPTVESGVQVGAGCVLREGVTISRPATAGQKTILGEGCYLMAASHVGHDCVLGDRVILANGVLLGGHVAVGSHAFLGGLAAVHQFCRIGEGTMISGHSAISLDVPPNTLTAQRNEVIGLNLIGLKRRGFSREAIADLKNCFRAVYFENGNIRELARSALEKQTAKTEAGEAFLRFFLGGSRGFIRTRRGEVDAPAEA